MTCRDEDTGKFTTEHKWEYAGYGHDIDVDVEGDYIHVVVQLVCEVCGEEMAADNSWLVN
jgi:hypothetical protein